MAKDRLDNIKQGSGLPERVFADADKQIRERTDRFRQVYANNMRVSFSTWDCSLTFGEITGERDGQPIIEETVKILTTREIAKTLMLILKGQIDVFEAQYGEIKIPVAADDKFPDTPTEDQGKPESS